eukprot:m.108900 g.108900  ORF g.108900 m.108900 type:complete len:53 (-) comp12828_c0_seq1:3578-3736(-)
MKDRGICIMIVFSRGRWADYYNVVSCRLSRASAPLICDSRDTTTENDGRFSA